MESLGITNSKKSYHISTPSSISNVPIILQKPLPTISQSESTFSSHLYSGFPHSNTFQEYKQSNQTISNLGNQSKSHLSSFQSLNREMSNYYQGQVPYILPNNPFKTKSKSPENKKYASQSQILMDWRINIMKNKKLLSNWENKLILKNYTLLRQVFQIMTDFFSPKSNESQYGYQPQAQDYIEKHIKNSYPNQKVYRYFSIQKLKSTQKIVQGISKLLISLYFDTLSNIKYSNEKDLFVLSNTLNKNQLNSKTNMANQFNRQNCNILELNSLILINKDQHQQNQQQNIINNNVSAQEPKSNKSNHLNQIQKNQNGFEQQQLSDKNHSDLYVSIQTSRSPKSKKDSSQQYQQIHIFGTQNFLKLDSNFKQIEKKRLKKNYNNSSSQSQSQDFSLKQDSEYKRLKIKNKNHESKRTINENSSTLNGLTFNINQKTNDYGGSIEDLSNIILNMNKVDMQGINFGTEQDLQSTLKLNKSPSNKQLDLNKKNSQSQKIIQINHNHNTNVNVSVTVNRTKDSYQPQKVQKAQNKQQSQHKINKLDKFEIEDSDILPMETKILPPKQQKNRLPQVQKVDSPLFSNIKSPQQQNQFSLKPGSKQTGQTFLTSAIQHYNRRDFQQNRKNCQSFDDKHKIVNIQFTSPFTGVRAQRDALRGNDSNNKNRAVSNYPTLQNNINPFIRKSQVQASNSREWNPSINARGTRVMSASILSHEKRPSSISFKVNFLKPETARQPHIQQVQQSVPSPIFMKKAAQEYYMTHDSRQNIHKNSTKLILNQDYSMKRSNPKVTFQIKPQTQTNKSPSFSSSKGINNNKAYQRVINYQGPNRLGTARSPYEGQPINRISSPAHSGSNTNSGFPYQFAQENSNFISQPTKSSNMETITDSYGLNSHKPGYQLRHVKSSKLFGHQQSTNYGGSDFINEEEVNFSSKNPMNLKNYQRRNQNEIRESSIMQKASRSSSGVQYNKFLTKMRSPKQKILVTSSNKFKFH